VSLAGVVTEQNPAGVVLQGVVGHGRMIDPDEMDSFTAVEGLASLEIGDAGTRGNGRFEFHVVVGYGVAPDRDE